MISFFLAIIIFFILLALINAILSLLFSKDNLVSIFEITSLYTRANAFDIRLA